MTRESHCNVCDHKGFNTNLGTICGLTDKKPTFEAKCDSIIFGGAFKEQIKEINTEFEHLSTQSNKELINFLMYLSISAIVTSTGVIIGLQLDDKGWFATHPWIIVIIGLALLPKATHRFSNYRQSLSASRTKKIAFDDVLSVYTKK